MSKFEELHPDIIEQLPSCEHYVQRSVSGRIIEAWTKIDGEWVDTTLREQEIERAQLELKAAIREAAKIERENKEANNEVQNQTNQM